MAITIRNKEIEAMIRTICDHTGEGPTALIHRLASQALENPRSRRPRDEIRRRMAELEESTRRHAPPPSERPSPEESRRMQRELDAYLDEGADAGSALESTRLAS